MARWDPWRGCHRYSEGCKFCYIHKGDAKRGVDTNCITKTDKFNVPIVRKKNGEYKMKSGLVSSAFPQTFAGGYRSLAAGMPGHDSSMWNSLHQGRQGIQIADQRFVRPGTKSRY